MYRHMEKRASLEKFAYLLTKIAVDLERRRFFKFVPFAVAAAPVAVAGAVERAERAGRAVKAEAARRLVDAGGLRPAVNGAFDAATAMHGVSEAAELVQDVGELSAKVTRFKELGPVVRGLARLRKGETSSRAEKAALGAVEGVMDGKADGYVEAVGEVASAPLKEISADRRDLLKLLAGGFGWDALGHVARMARMKLVVPLKAMGLMPGSNYPVLDRKDVPNRLVGDVGRRMVSFGTTPRSIAENPAVSVLSGDDKSLRMLKDLTEGCPFIF